MFEENQFEVIQHTILVIPHYILRLNRTHEYLDNIFLDSQSLLLCYVLVFCLQFSSRDAIKNKQANEIHCALCARNMEDIVHYILQLLL